MIDFDHRLAEGADTTAVIGHPHPDMGGNRYHPVVDVLYRGLPISTLRFDFTSSDPDAAAAQMAEAIEVAGGERIVLAGYSFGADIALSVDDPRVLGWFLVAPPLRLVDVDGLTAPGDPRPKALAVPEHDQFSPPTRAAQVSEGWTATTLAVVRGGDHFLAGCTGQVLDLAVAWLPTALGSPPPSPD